MDSCANCGGPLPTDHGCHGPEGHKFCDRCAGLADALAIGARQPVVLYESAKPGMIGGLGAATGWCGEVMGYVCGKTVPFWGRGTNARRRDFCPVRFRVRMLDGSLWHGSGPTCNGTYIRLQPMKGQ